MSQIRWFSRAPRTLCVGFLFAAFALCAGAQTVSSDLYAGMRWRSIGPYRSGNVYAVAGVNEDPTVYYLGLPGGGVCKTTDGGTVGNRVVDAGQGCVKVHRCRRDLEAGSVGRYPVSPRLVGGPPVRRCGAGGGAGGARR